MEFKIYSNDGRLKLTVEPRDNSTQVEEIQAGNILNVSFTLPKRVSLGVNDYADFMCRRYWLTEKYCPVQKSTIEWEYSLKLYGQENLISRFLVLNTTDGYNEAIFSLTAPPREHVALIVKSINSGFKTNDWKVGTVEGGENIVVDYRGKYCDAALKAVADAVGTEYWIEGTTVNICRCEHGEPVTLGYRNGLTKIQPDVADNAKVYTRLFPTGSSKNIDPVKYGHSRLQLPGGVQYVDINTDKYGIIHHYEDTAFSGIFPRYTGTVSNVRNEERTNDDGDKFTVYYFKDDNLPFDPNEYDLGSLVKRVTFQEGSELAGLGSDDNGTHYFEINFDSDTREFEIITQFTDTGQLPGDVLVPKPGDRFVPWNMLMPDEYYPLAEAEFLAAVHEYNRRHCIDVSCFKAPTDYIEIERRKLDLHVGQRVRLESPDYFPEIGYKDSRITKITRKINRPSQMDLEISDALSTGALDKINDNINDVRNYAKQLAESNALPDIIRTGDRTQWTDNNLLSALRTKSEFLSRIADDIAEGRITFKQGLTAIGSVIFKDGAHFGDFVAGLYTGTGAGVDRDGNMEVQSLRVRSYLEVLELLVNRLSAIEGDQLLTEADTIERVVHIEGDVYGLYLRPKWEGYFTAISEGSVLKGIINTLAQGSGTYYTAWSRVNSVNTALNYIEVSMYPDSEVPGGRNFPPCEMMNVARWGHQTDPRRQSCIYLSSTEGRIVRLTAVTRPIIDKSNYGLVLGEIPDGLVDDPNIIPGRDYLFAQGIITNQIIHVDRTGRPVATLVDRGPWQQGGKYLFETVNPDTDILETSTVWHYGCRWKCMSSGTTDEPTYKSTAWAFLEGNPYFTVRFDAGDHVVIDPDDFRLPLNIIAELYNRDVTADVADTDVEWSRYSEDAEGNPRTASDNAWAIAHAAAGKGLTLTPADLDLNGTGLPRTMVFRATVRFRDGHTSTADFAYL